MPYLIPSDYTQFIADTSLAQIISGNADRLPVGELLARKEIAGYLSQRYDIDSEFTDTLPYNNQSTYKAGSRVYLDAPAYNILSTYLNKALTLQNGNVYESTEAVTAPEAFNPAKWQLLGSQYDLFYCQLPQLPFSITGNYKTGDKVFYSGHTYTATAPSVQLGHEDILQYGNSAAIPYKNNFPNDPVFSRWNDEGAYVVPAGSLLNTQYFTKGDNRDPLMVMSVLDINLYHLYCRINKPMPPERENRYNATVTRLRLTGKGEVTTDLSKKQPPQGGRIRYGSNIKNVNSY